jgi:hypothetical protein
MTSLFSECGKQGIGRLIVLVRHDALALQEEREASASCGTLTDLDAITQGTMIQVTPETCNMREVCSLEVWASKEPLVTLATTAGRL